ncbi:hypothetical protein [Thalassolituus sp.]|jgi:hypothetical protein|uniref:hypothetical protein n=1 Tax=Thalassolituus sp. TaxID=2030822 RepID=UPI00351883CD
MVLGPPSWVRTERSDKRPELATALIPTGHLSGLVGKSLHFLVSATNSAEARSIHTFYA